MAIPTFPSPPGLTFPVKRTPMVSTLRNQAVSGRRTMLPLWSYPLYHYEIAFDVLRQQASLAEWQALEAFWKQVQTSPGMLFSYADPNDGSVTDQSLGVGDGTTTAFQLVRSLGGYAEPVFNPTGSLTIKDNGTATSAYALGNYGVVTFNSAPVAGHTLTWTGSFAFYCTFDDDSVEFANFMSGLWSVDKLAFTTWRP